MVEPIPQEKRLSRRDAASPSTQHLPSKAEAHACAATIATVRRMRNTAIAPFAAAIRGRVGEAAEGAADS